MCSSTCSSRRGSAGALLLLDRGELHPLRVGLVERVEREAARHEAVARRRRAVAEGAAHLACIERCAGEDVATYAEVLDLIRRHADPSDAILAVPGGAEFYFLSGRRNPLPYPYIVYGVMDDESLDHALAALRRDPPALVVHVPSLPYNTRHTDRLMEELKAGATLIATVREFNVYKRNRPSSAPAGAAPTP